MLSIKTAPSKLTSEKHKSRINSPPVFKGVKTKEEGNRNQTVEVLVKMSGFKASRGIPESHGCSLKSFVHFCGLCHKTSKRFLCASMFVCFSVT